VADFGPAKKLREHRPLLLAMEAVGWLHMTGKARAEFLREHGGQKTNYDDRRWHERESPPFPWEDLLQWVKAQFPTVGGANVAWPSTLTEFLTKHRDRNAGMLGLLQAGHGMASGIEKNLPPATSEYLGQDITHMWLSSAFGQPVRNLLGDPPEMLTESGWRRLLSEARHILEELGTLGTANAADVGAWQRWRESAIGLGSALRAAFSSTVAETRLPNNEVTLWDQSYVAAALFKSAVAGAILEGSGFPWASKDLKQATRWRLLTVGMGTDHYEARAVRIGDWIGARAGIDTLFDQVCQLVEVDLTVGSLLYRDASLCVFTFPGEHSDGTTAGLKPEEWRQWLEGEIEELAKGLSLETPPCCRISEPTRSLVPMVKETRAAREALAVPVHRSWSVVGSAAGGHVCPVCLVRRNGSANNKQRPCEVCQKRRRGRLEAWLGGKLDHDTIWIDEVADADGRVALLTLSLDLEPWLGGAPVDSLRAQGVVEWRTHNPELSEYWQRDESRRRKIPNPVDPLRSFDSLLRAIRQRLSTFDNTDLLLANIQEGYRYENDWPTFFGKIVEDRADAPRWDELDDEQRARWLVHQLFGKLASPGRIYRFWRQAEEFFRGLLAEFREMAARDANRWRVRRLTLVPDQASAGAGWQDREIYDGRLGDAPVSLLYRQDSQDFVTACNLARLLRAEEAAEALRDKEILLRGDDRVERTLRVQQVKEAGLLGAYCPVIPLELSPFRCRVLVPLEAASTCLDRAVEAWNEQFGRVWDRLPLRAGVVAFPQKLPFQAVIEAARNVEDELNETTCETWRVTDRDARSGVVALMLKRPDYGGSELRTIPITLPDGRTDVFYPYLAVQDRAVRFPRDFQHPDGQVYRHALDLRLGDGISVEPARVATVFLDSTGRRFEAIGVRPLAEWPRMRDVWRLIERTAPSLTALRGAWADLVARRESWQSAEDGWTPGGREAWRDLARAILADRLGVGGAALDAVAEAADDGTLAWALDWHLSVLKEQIGEVTHA
jgi:CRISPR-associated Csx11 family protein